jgi:acyl-CoA hydrolase
MAAGEAAPVEFGDTVSRAESLRVRPIPVTGGQAQFLPGAPASAGGKGFIGLPSTCGKGGQRRSRIVPPLTPGDTVTTTRAAMMDVVAEPGMVNLKGRSVPERARLPIPIARPEFREAPERATIGAGMLPRGVSVRGAARA